MKLLFTSVGRRVELLQAFRSAAEALNLSLSIHGADLSDSAPALSFCDACHLVPRINEDSYLPTLLSICEKEHIDCLIPTIDTDLLLLAKNKASFAHFGTKVLISAPDKVALCRDKRLTTAFFHSCGLAAPSVCDDVKAYDGGYPAFIKPKDGSSSVNAFRIDNAEQLEYHASKIPGYIIQPFVSGTEYTVDIFCDLNGKPIYITPRIRTAVRAGEVLKTEIRLDETIIEEMKRLVAAFRPCGGITVQLIQDKMSGKNMYIEINPRFGGGAPLSMKAGADAASALLRVLSGETVAYQENAAEDGAVFCRFDQSIRVK